MQEYAIAIQDDFQRTFVWPFILALITGSLLSICMDRIPLQETHIPSYGYYSTVVFTEPASSLYAVYIPLVFLKGLFYLGAFYLFQSIFL